MDEAIEVHGLSDDKSGCLETVTGVELGVMRLDDGVGVVTFVAEDTMAVRKPRYFNPLSSLQFATADAFAGKGLALHVRAGGKRCKISLPVGVADELRKQAERGVTCGVCTGNIAPQTFERGGRYMLMQARLHFGSEELKIIGRADVTVHIALDVLTQAAYFRGILIHCSAGVEGVCIVACVMLSYLQTMNGVGLAVTEDIEIAIAQQLARIG